MAGTITLLCGNIHKGEALDLFTKNSKSEQLDSYVKLAHRRIAVETDEVKKIFEISDTEITEDMVNIFRKIFAYQYLSITCLCDPIFTSIHISPKIKIKLIIEIAKKCRDFDRDFCIATNDSIVFDTLRVCVAWGIINKDQLNIQFYGNDLCHNILIDRNGTTEFCPEYFFDSEEELLSILIFGKEDTLKQLPSNRYIKYLEDNNSTNKEQGETQNETRRSDCSNIY